MLPCKVSHKGNLRIGSSTIGWKTSMTAVKAWSELPRGRNNVAEKDSFPADQQSDT